MTLKLCSTCKEEIPLSGFHKKKSGKHGVRSVCKSCRKEETRQRYINNKDKIDTQSKEWNKNNVEKRRIIANRWGKNNRDNTSFHDAKRRASKKQAIPKWLSIKQIEEIKAIYILASNIRESGIDVHVDHIVPLQGKNVRGLHVPWNLQILDAETNHKKGNKYE